MKDFITKVSREVYQKEAAKAATKNPTSILRPGKSSPRDKSLRGVEFTNAVQVSPDNSDTTNDSPRKRLFHPSQKKRKAKFAKSLKISKQKRHAKQSRGTRNAGRGGAQNGNGRRGSNQRRK